MKPNERLVPETIGVCIDKKYARLPVTQTIAHSPGTHATSPIRNEMTAVEVKTAHHSRWYGFDRAWIGSDLRMHVQGFPPHFEEVAAWEKP